MLYFLKLKEEIFSNNSDKQLESQEARGAVAANEAEETAGNNFLGHSQRTARQRPESSFVPTLLIATRGSQLRTEHDFNETASLMKIPSAY